MLSISIIKCLTDNYSYLLKDEITNTVGIVDPSEFTTVDKEIERKYKKLDFILKINYVNLTLQTREPSIFLDNH